MKEHGPLVEGFPLVKGLLCGSLLAGSATVPYGMLVQTVLFIIAAAVFLDTLFIFGREVHLLGFLAAMVFGAAVGVAFALASLIGPYMLVIFIAMLIVYLYEFMSYREGRGVKSGVARLMSR
jgi:hypothetical protein